MSWINEGKFQLFNKNGRKYVYRRRSNGTKQEITVPNKVDFVKPAVKRWLKATYKSPALKPSLLFNPGTNWGRRTPSPNNKSFNCTMLKRMFHLETVNGKLGMNTVNINKNNLSHVNLVPIKNRRMVRGPGRLDAGKQGVVFYGSFYSSGKEPFVVKVSPFDRTLGNKVQIQDVEYQIQKAIYKINIMNIAKPYAYFTCDNFIKNSNFTLNRNENKNYSKQLIMVSEYINNGSLYKYLDKMVSRLKDKHLMNMIRQVLDALTNIQMKYPEFRHNDLHLGNILVKASYTPGTILAYPTMVIADFGFSRIKKHGSNPLVDSKNYESSWGIGPDTDARYDSHFFLNELRKWVSPMTSKFPETAKFLNDAIPEGYRKDSDIYVHNSRLKYGISYPGLKTIRQLLSPKVLIPPKPAPKPAPKTNAARKVGAKWLAAARSRIQKRTSPRRLSNNDLLKMSAINFLKLSPKTKARAMMIRKGKAVVKANVKGKAAVNNTKRVNTKPMGAAPVKKGKTIPPAILKSNKFNKLVTKIYENRGSLAGGANFGNAWNKARLLAINRIQNRINKNIAAFTPSVNAPRPKIPSPPKPKPKVASPRRLNVIRTPSTQRIKLKGPTGRMVYADGLTMDVLKAIASREGVNTKQLKTKVSIAEALFYKK